MSSLITLCTRYLFTRLLMLVIALPGCSATRPTAGIDRDAIARSNEPVARYSGEWGKVITGASGCVDLTGEYSIVPVSSRLNADAGPFGGNATLGDFVGLPSHNWPLKYPLVKQPTVRVDGGGGYRPVDFLFRVETKPFLSQMVSYQCLDGWTRTLNEFELEGRGDYLGDAYLSRTETGDLILFYRSWVRNTAYLGLHRYEKLGDYWFLFRAADKP